MAVASVSVLLRPSSSSGIHDFPQVPVDEQNPFLPETTQADMIHLLASTQTPGTRMQSCGCSVMKDIVTTELRRR